MSIDGQPETCTIDSGARISFVKDSLKFKDYPIRGTHNLTGVSGAEIQTDLIEVSNLKMGALSYSNITIGRSSNLPFPCIIGSDILKQQPLAFNFEKRVLSNIALNDKSYDLKSNSDLWFGFPVKIGEFAEVDCLWDTGAAITVIDMNSLDLFKGNYEVVGQSEISDATGNKQKTLVIKINKLQFGNVENSNVLAMATDLSKLQSEAPSVKMILGYNVIRWFNWQIDYQNLKWSVTKY